MDTVNSTQEQIGNVSTEMEILRKNQKEVPEDKNTVTEMNSVFDDLVDYTELRKTFLSLKISKQKS